MSNSGRKTWLFQKYSSIALIPLVSYFLVKILQLSSMTYEQIVSETSSLWFLVLVLIFAVIGLLHMRLGLHEVIEDVPKKDEDGKDLSDEESASDKIYMIIELARYQEIMSWNMNTYKFMPNPCLLKSESQSNFIC